MSWGSRSSDPRGDDPREGEARDAGAAEGPIVRDRRRIDPVTGQVRQVPAADPLAAAAAGVEPGADADMPTGQAAAGSDAQADRVAELEQEVANRVSDLQRLQAEYVNYKRRVDRDRQVVRDMVVASAMGELLPVLDDIGRAREHGELSGGFKVVAESLGRAVLKVGLERFGDAGDPFDPRIHEALMHAYSDEVTEPTCQAILQDGYRFGDRIVRPARVAVVEPTAAPLPDAGSPEGAQVTAEDTDPDQVPPDHVQD